MGEDVRRKAVSSNSDSISYPLLESPFRLATSSISTQPLGVERMTHEQSRRELRDDPKYIFRFRRTRIFSVIPHQRLEMLVQLPTHCFESFDCWCCVSDEGLSRRISKGNINFMRFRRDSPPSL